MLSSENVLEDKLSIICCKLQLFGIYIYPISPPLYIYIYIERERDQNMVLNLLRCHHTATNKYIYK